MGAKKHNTLIENGGRGARRTNKERCILPDTRRDLMVLLYFEITEAKNIRTFTTSNDDMQRHIYSSWTTVLLNFIINIELAKISQGFPTGVDMHKISDVVPSCFQVLYPVILTSSTIYEMLPCYQVIWTEFCATKEELSKRGKLSNIHKYSRCINILNVKLKLSSNISVENPI